MDELSFLPLHIEMYFEDMKLADGTAFMYFVREYSFLISARHNFTGRHADSGRLLSNDGAIPNKIKVWFPTKTQPTTWVEDNFELYNSNGKALWYDHPELPNCDVTSLSINRKVNGALLFGLDPTLAHTELYVGPSEPISIIGFPLSSSSQKFPIWKTGHVATDPELNYNQQPIFLVDATTRQGMSGAPVVAKRVGAYQKTPGSTVIGSSTTKFLGIYTGRVTSQSEVGIVWKPIVLDGLTKQHEPT